MTRLERSVHVAPAATIAALVVLCWSAAGAQQCSAGQIRVPDGLELAEQINSLIKAIDNVHDLCLMAIGLFCATRTSETFGLRWKAYLEEGSQSKPQPMKGIFIIAVKTEASRSTVPVPEDIRPIIEAWKRKCPDTSPEALLMFPTSGRDKRTGQKVPRHPKNFPQVADLPHYGQARNPTEAGHLSGDAADAGNRPASARHDEGCANGVATRQHQDDRQRVHAAQFRPV